MGRARRESAVKLNWPGHRLTIQFTVLSFTRQTLVLRSTLSVELDARLQRIGVNLALISASQQVELRGHS